jgi:hypothetical protein
MELDLLFDELEHKFSPQRYDWNRQINCLKVQLVGKEFVDLLAPIIGVNFVAGLDKQNADWFVFSLKTIASLLPHRIEDDELPLVRRQELQLVDFIATLDRPVRVSAKLLDQSEVAFNILDIQEPFIVTESNTLIPLEAITQIRVLGTNSWE